MASSHLGRQESVEVRVEGEDWVVGHPLQELVQSFHPGLHKLLGETVHHALHHKLLRQRLQPRNNKENHGRQVFFKTNSQTSA